MVSLKLEEINPFVRFGQFIKIQSDKQYVDIASYDYRIFLCAEGKGKIVIEDTAYKMEKGALLLWRPGIRYSLLPADDNTPFELVGANFDFTQNHKNKKKPIPPTKWRNFKKEKILETVEFSNFEAFNKPLYIPEIQKVDSYIRKIALEYISNKDFNQPLISGLLKVSLSLIARTEFSGSIPKKSEIAIDKLLQFIHSNYNEKIDNKLLGEKFGYHPNHLNRLLLKHTGLSVHQYLINYRITAAIELLGASDMSTEEISEVVGFKDVSHFFKYFKKVTGKHTKEFRK